MPKIDIDSVDYEIAKSLAKERGWSVGKLVSNLIRSAFVAVFSRDNQPTVKVKQGTVRKAGRKWTRAQRRKFKETLSARDKTK
jgi:hypothetical protein